MKLSVSIACLATILFSTIAIQSSQAATSIDSGIKDPCPDAVYDVNFTDTFGESIRKECHKKLDQLTDIPEFDLETNSKSKTHFTVDYDNSCPIGMESANGCDSNPDAQLCDDGTTPYLLVIRYSGGDNDGQVFSSRLVCPEDNVEIPENIIREIIVTPEHFRRYPIRGSKLNSDPQQFSLRNGHSHMWATGNEQSFNDQIDNTPVLIKAIPVQWQWNYGDGISRNLDFPGEPLPSHTLHQETSTSHSYVETGTFTVTLTTIYRGEFRVGNGPWQPIGGQAAVPSTPIQIDVWKTKKELIANE